MYHAWRLDVPYGTRTDMRTDITWEQLKPFPIYERNRREDDERLEGWCCAKIDEN